MTLYEEMQALREKQRVIEDGYRLFHDGTIKTATVTDSLEPGWYILARSIPGASIAFRSHFAPEPEGLFLRVEGMREAIALRDRMIEHVVELRVQRQFEAGLQAEQQQPEPGDYPVTF